MLNSMCAHHSSTFILRGSGYLRFRLLRCLDFRISQPYESLSLRLTGTAICLATLMRDRWPGWLQRAYYPISYVLMLAALPVFFTFMTLMNGANTPWLMSTMAALLFVVLVYDVANAIIVTLLGSAIGILAFFAVAGIQPLPMNYVICFPILMFAVIAVVFSGLYRTRHCRPTVLSCQATCIEHRARNANSPIGYSTGQRAACHRSSADFRDTAAGQPPSAARCR